MNYITNGRTCLVLLAVALATSIPRAEVIEQILVKVNGEIFTKSDLEARQVAETAASRDPMMATATAATVSSATKAADAASAASARSAASVITSNRSRSSSRTTRPTRLAKARAAASSST